ncbi:hypothetical protein AeMF1_002742 [Aphanomyces euteiches]|nr:hypothetical protein AeMF1_002742 [Aphanomyces euteiches]KAH9190696.1 hypothetical protein AeNC1_007334 [Aphanomyces euteiches]
MQDSSMLVDPNSASIPSLTSTSNIATINSPVLKNVRGFYQVKNETDLISCMENLNSLFNRAIDMETTPSDESSSAPVKKQTSRPPRRPQTALSPRSAQLQEFTNQADELLSGDPNQLKKLLLTPEMRAAMNETGITKEELASKSIEDFTKEKHRQCSLTLWAEKLISGVGRGKKNSLALLLQVASDNSQVQERPSTSSGQDYDRELAHEHKLLEAMIKGRLKYEKILEKEAEKIRQKRAKYVVMENGVPLRNAEETYSAQLRQQMNAEKCELNRAKMERVQKQRELLEETKKQNADARRRYEQSKLEHCKQEKDVLTREKKAIEEKRQKKRQQEASLQEKRRTTQWQSMLRKESKRLMNQEREANVLHIKNVQAFKKAQAAKKIAANYRRIDNLNEVKRAIVDERKRIHKLARIRYNNCKHLSEEIRLTPGPGEYNPPLSVPTSGGGGAWSPLPNGPTDIQKLHETPGPGAYEDTNSIQHSMKYTGTTFAKSRLLNTLEMQLGPGPGQYISSAKSSTLNKNNGPLFLSSNVPSPFELALRRAAELPAPCDYSPTTHKDATRSTIDFRRALHTMTTSYLLASKDKEDIMIDTDINALEHDKTQ